MRPNLQVLWAKTLSGMMQQDNCISALWQNTGIWSSRAMSSPQFTGRCVGQKPAFTREMELAQDGGEVGRAKVGFTRAKGYVAMPAQRKAARADLRGFYSSLRKM
jgi:hypothetical protein